jgi:hypothetical protein
VPRRPARNKPEKQLDLPTPAPPATIRVLPMHLKSGDRLADETGEWEVVGRPYTTNAGKTAHVRVKKVRQPETTEIRSWGAHERVAVSRGG